MSSPILWSPTGRLDVRGPDDYASQGGAFGANRTHMETNGGKPVQTNEPHLGVDLVCPPLLSLTWPCDGTLWQVGFAYEGDPRFHSVHVKPYGYPDYDIKMLYLTPIWFHTPKDVRAHEPMGAAEDLRLRYPDPDATGPKKAITNHVHFAVYYRGEAVDPSPLLRGIA